MDLDQPWTVEDGVIALMQPPLNLAGNASHPLHGRLTSLRAALRRRASTAEQPGAGSSPQQSRSAIKKPRAASIEQSPNLVEHRTQRVTANDIQAGQIPRGTTKTLFPADRQDVTLRIRGRTAACRWDPRYAPPERSGVIRIGRAAAHELLRPGDVLDVQIQADGLALD
jgi:hypothetical protein